MSKSESHIPFTSRQLSDFILSDKLGTEAGFVVRDPQPYLRKEIRDILVFES